MGVHLSNTQIENAIAKPSTLYKQTLSISARPTEICPIEGYKNMYQCIRLVSPKNECKIIKKTHNLQFFFIYCNMQFAKK